MVFNVVKIGSWQIASIILLRIVIQVVPCLGENPRNFRDELQEVIALAVLLTDALDTKPACFLIHETLTRCRRGTGLVDCHNAFPEMVTTTQNAPKRYLIK